MSNEGIDMMPEYSGLPHVHICTICEKQYECEEEDCDETDDTAICESCLEYDDGVEEDDNDYDS
jgi:hypothetical protein